MFCFSFICSLLNVFLFFLGFVVVVVVVAVLWQSDGIFSEWF